MRTTIRARATAGVTWTATTFVVGQAVQLATGVVLARLLTTADFGTAGLALTVTTVVGAVTQFGLFAALVQRREVRREHLDTALWTSLGSAVAFGGLLLLLAGPLAGWLRHPGLAPVLRVGALMVGAGSLSSVQSGLLTREFRFRELALATLVSRLGGGVVSIGLALVGAGVMSIVWGGVLQLALVAGLQAPAALKLHRPGRRVSFRALRELLGYGAGMMGANLLNQFSVGLDTLLVGRLLGPSRLGWYSLAAQGGYYLPRGATSILSNVTFTSLSRAQDRTDLLRAAYQRLSGACCLLLGPVLTVAIVAAPDLIPAALGQKWLPSVPLFQLLAAAGLVMALDWVWCEVLKARGRTGQLLVLTTLRVAALAAAVIAAAPHGLVWVALAVPTVRTAFWLGYQRLLRRSIGLGIGDYLRGLSRPLAVAGLTGAGAFAARHLLFQVVPSGTLPGLAVTAAAGAVLALALAPLLALPDLVALLEAGAGLPRLGRCFQRLLALLQPMRPDSVCIITAVHHADDARILHKQAMSLSRAGMQVRLLAPTRPCGDTGPVTVITVPLPRPRALRMTVGAARLLGQALRSRAPVCHIHDPELLPVALCLRLLGRRVVYDIHEDYPRQMLSKHYLAPALRRPAAALISAIERLAAGYCDGFVAATESIAARFPPGRTAIVRNYPVLPAPGLVPRPFATPPFRVVHLAGRLSADRGITTLVQALGRLDDRFQLVLAGRFEPAAYHDELASLPGWRRVRLIRPVPHQRVGRIYARCSAGAVCLLPLPRYRVSLPVKLFEFMAAGLPVVVSDFPLLRRIVAESGCGICIDPQRPDAVADALRQLAADPERAAAMGAAGMRATRDRYHWQTEASALLRLYARLAAPRPAPQKPLTVKEADIV